MTHPGGRPKKEIDFEAVNRMAFIHCTGEEIAAVLDIDYDTLNARIKEEYKLSFSDYIKIKAGPGRVSLRRRQWKAAIDDGNTTMLIWLGKQYLGQTDKNDLDMTSTTRVIINEEFLPVIKGDGNGGNGGHNNGNGGNGDG